MITSLRGDDGSRAALDPQPRAARLAIAIGARSGMSVNMTRFFRALFAVLAGLLVVGGLAACDEATEDIDLPEVELDPGEESPDGDAAPPSGEDDGDGGGDDDDGEALDDHGALGSLGAELLSPDLSRAQLEIDASDGVGLTGAARDALAERLADHGGKAVEFAGGATLPSRDTWSNGQLRTVAREHRAISSTTESVAVHVLAVSGEHENGSTLGVALDASTFALFPEAMRGGLLGGLSGDDVEVAVAVHELGHLFGLVNLTGEGGFHEDPENPNHSQSEDSVMYWAIETDAISQVFDGPPPTTFDEADRQEMERIRS